MVWQTDRATWRGGGAQLREPAGKLSGFPGLTSEDDGDLCRQTAIRQRLLAVLDTTTTAKTCAVRPHEILVFAFFLS